MRSPRPLSIAVVLLQVAALFAFATGADAARGSLPPSEWVIGPQKHVAFITLDGQTSSKHFLAVIDALKAESARASFFVSGSWVAHHSTKATLARKLGNAFGNRGFGKDRFTNLSDSELRSSIARAQSALQKIGAHPKPFLRAPKGDRNARVLQVAGSMGYRSVRWTYHAGGGTPKKVAHKVVHAAQNGSIISLDLWRNSHRAALPTIVRGLRRKGFRLKTLPSLKKAHSIRWDETFKYGSSGHDVFYLQKTLNSISYPAGGNDGRFGYPTEQAVWAFEKYYGLTRDATVTPAEMSMIAVAQRPKTPSGKGKNFIDVDVSRQVLVEVHHGRVTHTLPVSSGGEYQYSDGGSTHTAHTPRGSFSIIRKVAGWRTSSLGRMWYPNYFYSGFAIHGEPEVPPYPVSHGCVRIPMYVAKPFFYRNPIGTPVYVHD
jgi:peptidoglycan/xylan/chitin deacetylase (PgdA/CDA1 family)